MDAFLTRLPDGYVLETRTAKGTELLKHGDFSPATADQDPAGPAVNEGI